MHTQDMNCFKLDGSRCPDLFAYTGEQPCQKKTIGKGRKIYSRLTGVICVNYQNELCNLRTDAWTRWTHYRVKMNKYLFIHTAYYIVEIAKNQRPSDPLPTHETIPMSIHHFDVDFSLFPKQNERRFEALEHRHFATQCMLCNPRIDVKIKVFWRWSRRPIDVDFEVKIVKSMSSFLCPFRRYWTV